MKITRDTLRADGLTVGDKRKLTGNFVDDVFSHAKEINSVSAELFDIQRMLAGVGNHFLADQLLDLSDQLSHEAKLICEVLANKTHADLMQSQESAGNMIKACLAIATIPATP